MFGKLQQQPINMEKLKNGKTSTKISEQQLQNHLLIISRLGLMEKLDTPLINTEPNIDWEILLSMELLDLSKE